MGKKKCENEKPPQKKESHKYSCKKCGHFSRKKDRLCKAEKVIEELKKY